MGYLISTKIVSELFEDEAILVDLERGSYYSLRAAAFQIWKVIEEGYGQEQIMDICERKEASSLFLDYLLSEALVVIGNTEPPAVLLEEKITGIPEYTKYEDMKDLLLLDPIHEVDQRGWPNKLPE